MSYCPDCDLPEIWGGMSWVPHTEEQHAATRHRLIRGVIRVLRERLAVQLGHRVSIRFTATDAWFECQCGSHGVQQPDSAYARRDGHVHLYIVGTVAL